MPVRYGHVWLTLFCVLVLTGCRDQDIKPQTESSAALTVTQARISHQPVSGNGNRRLKDEIKAGQATASPTQPGQLPEEPSSTVVAPQPRVPIFSRKSEVYDRRGEAFALLQSPKKAMQALPADAQGKVDWVSALSQGLIQPRASLSGKGKMRRRFDEIVMKDTRDMPWVKFPHAEHTEWLDCSNCHPEPFRERKGGNQITMETIMRGQHCGTCHDRVAFSIFACERCHSLPHAGSPAKWW